MNAVRRTPTQERAKGRVEVLLDATAAVLQAAGYAKTSTNRIARQAGVPIGSLYQYFDSREALVGALIRRQAERELDLLRAALAKPPKASLTNTATAVVRALIEIYGARPELHRVLQEEVPRGLFREERDAFDRQGIELIRAILMQHQRDLAVGDLGLAAFILVHVVEGVIHHAVSTRRKLLRDGRLEREAIRLVLTYLTAKSPN